MFSHPKTAEARRQLRPRRPDARSLHWAGDGRCVPAEHCGSSRRARPRPRPLERRPDPGRECRRLGSRHASGVARPWCGSSPSPGPPLSRRGTARPIDRDPGAHASASSGGRTPAVARIWPRRPEVGPLAHRPGAQLAARIVGLAANMSARRSLTADGPHPGQALRLQPDPEPRKIGGGLLTREEICVVFCRGRARRGIGWNHLETGRQSAARRTMRPADRAR